MNVFLWILLVLGALASVGLFVFALTLLWVVTDEGEVRR